MRGRSEIWMPAGVIDFVALAEAGTEARRRDPSTSQVPLSLGGMGLPVAMIAGRRGGALVPTA